MADVLHLTQAERDVLAERQRQIAKGYTPEHDNHHTPGQIARYGGSYVAPWPSREALVRKAACLIAAIDRIDRHTPQTYPDSTEETTP